MLKLIVSWLKSSILILISFIQKLFLLRFNMAKQEIRRLRVNENEDLVSILL